MHGPGTWWSPHYSQPIQIIDGVVGQISWGMLRRRNWRIARNLALDLWRESGVEIAMREEPHDRYNDGRPWLSWRASRDLLYVPDTILMLRWDQDGADRINFGHYEPRFNAGLNGFLFDDEMLKKYSRPQLKHLICHEVGHTLGLAHPDAGAPGQRTSVMGMGQVPDIHDLESIRDYYLKES